MKNKILPILCIFILLSLILVNTSFASTNETFTCSYNGTSYTVPALPEDVYNYNYYFIAKTSGSNAKYKLVYSNEPFIYVEKCTAFKEYGVDCITRGKITYYTYDPSTMSDWTKETKADLHISGFLKPSENYWYFLCYTNADICDESGTVFFHQAPVTAVEIPALETAEQIPEAMATALKMIIPVSLALLSILLLIYLMRRLICRSL